MNDKTIDRPVEDYSIAPALEPWVQEELTRIFGLNRFDEPNVRIVWGGSERHNGRLKYWVPGKTKFITTPILQNGVWAIRQERVEVGLPRWVIERFTDPSRLSAVEREAHPRGRYTFYYEVEDLKGEYRAPGRDTIEHIQACLASQDQRDREVDQELQRQIDEDNGPVGSVIGSNYITPEAYKEI